MKTAIVEETCGMPPRWTIYCPHCHLGDDMTGDSRIITCTRCKQAFYASWTGFIPADIRGNLEGGK